MELEMPNLRQTSSCVVSRCRLSSTTFSLYSAEYCLRLASIMSSTFLRLCFPYLPIYSIRYWTPPTDVVHSQESGTAQTTHGRVFGPSPPEWRRAARYFQSGHRRLRELLQSCAGLAEEGG